MYRLAPTPTVLVVDDDPVCLREVDAALSVLELDIVGALGAGAAKGFLRASTPDLILVELALADESGVELCRRWRNDQRLDRVPILVLTALAAANHRNAALSAGADDYLEKPVDSGRLQRIVRRWIATRRQAAPEPGPRSHDGELAGALRRAALHRDLRRPIVE